MALWLIRAGRDVEHERKFLDEQRVFLTWEVLVRDMVGQLLARYDALHQGARSSSP